MNTEKTVTERSFNFVYSKEDGCARIASLSEAEIVESFRLYPLTAIVGEVSIGDDSPLYRGNYFLRSEESGVRDIDADDFKEGGFSLPIPNEKHKTELHVLCFSPFSSLYHMVKMRTYDADSMGLLGGIPGYVRDVENTLKNVALAEK